MTQTPTDALRLVPNMPTVELTDDMLFKIETGETVTWGELKRRQYEQAVRNFNTMREDGSLPAPASPLPEGGDMDWQDKAEGLEADLRQAVLVAWKRGAEEWCRLNYPQWVEWLEACHAPAAPTGEPK